jgi:hypothetical protein
MTSDDQITSGLIDDIVDALERHGYFRSDDLHAGRAIGLIGDLARIYEGTQDHPADANPITVPSSAPARAGHRDQDRHDTVVLARTDLRTVLAALDVAADYKRDRAAACADCADQTCLTCQSRLRDAQAYDRMAAQILQAADARAEASAAWQRAPGHATPASGGLHAAPDKEAGQ